MNLRTKIARLEERLPREDSVEQGHIGALLRRLCRLMTAEEIEDMSRRACDAGFAAIEAGRPRTPIADQVRMLREQVAQAEAKWVRGRELPPLAWVDREIWGLP